MSIVGKCHLLRTLTLFEVQMFTSHLAVLAVILIFCVTRVAKRALEKALAENEDFDGIAPSPQLPIVADSPVHLNEPFIIKIDPSQDNHEK